MNLLVRPVRSSLGRKYLMALTGLILTGFVLVHMAGNLLLFVGPDALNSYAHGLKDRPFLLWPGRAFLLLTFLVHVYLGITLTLDNQKARPIRYEYERTLQASWASRHMLLTGLLLLAFVVYHLAHFTFGVVVQANRQRERGVEPGYAEVHKSYLQLAEVKDPGYKGYEPRPELNLSEALKEGKDARQDVYSMVISGFKNPWITGSYVLAMFFLALHLWHGGSSWLQSLGLNPATYRKLVFLIGPVLAVLVFVGNCSMPVAVLLGLVK